MCYKEFEVYFELVPVFCAISPKLWNVPVYFYMDLYHSDGVENHPRNKKLCVKCYK